MTHRQLREQIDGNLRSAGLEAQEIRLQPDPFHGWRAVIVSPDFERMSQAERKGMALTGLDRVTFQFIELLTPQEREWAGDLPLDSDLEDIPMWPEALARRFGDQPVVFASDLDEDLPRPIIATFYSLRGGVGRSTGLGYTAKTLARRGHSVLCVDMDLEAPGLLALFGRENEIEDSQGLVSILIDLDQGGNPDLLNHLVRISDSDELYCLPAGVPNADYARRLRLLDPEAWYREERNPLRDLMTGIGALPIRPDVVLIDARTGITPMSAPLLFDLSDIAIITFFPHPQARSGTEALVRAILRAQSQRIVSGQHLTPEPRFLVSPIPASNATEMQRYRLRALEWIDIWLSALEGQRLPEAPPIDSEEVTHLVPYRELIATSDRLMESSEIWQSYSAVAEWLERFIPVKSEERLPVGLREIKPSILTSLSFSAGTAEGQKNFLDSFVNTGPFDRAMSPDKPLVLGRKGTGKTALFRRLLEDPDINSIAVLCPAHFRGTYPWALSPEGFADIESTFTASKSGWREFWTAYTALGSFLATQRQGGVPPQPDQAFETAVRELNGEQQLTEGRVVSCLRQLLKTPRVGLLAWDWLQRLDTASPDGVYLLFDGLDTGFGNRPEERERRTQAIEGLLSFVMDRESALRHMSFKILLREDIWKEVRFENKSHLYGRSARLEWRSQADYARTIVKQALRNEDFKKLLTDVPISNSDVAMWSDDLVFQVWNVLIGERMRGGRTAFTRNWVWNRLADGKGDHGPRALLQLFREATAWEGEEHIENPYDRSVIRPRALIVSLPAVSEEALQALLEEYKELDKFVAALRGIGRSPIDARELESLGEDIKLAREVGLVAVHEGTEEEVQRYRIPDLFRSALGVTRRGPA
jgi:cellulose biosynthesis protein BcsQ